MFLLYQHGKVLSTLGPEFLPDSYRDKEKTLLKFKTSWASLSQTPSLPWSEDPLTFVHSENPSSCWTPSVPHGTSCRPGYSIQYSLACPRMLCCFQVHLPTNPLLVNLELKWLFPTTETSLWMHHKRWHFSRAGCFWKNTLDECQARPHEMSWWLSKETCQELGWIKIATAPCGCEKSKDHRGKGLFVFKIIISKWFWACRIHQKGRQGKQKLHVWRQREKEEKGSRWEAGGGGDGASDSSPSQVLRKAWKTPLGWQASVSPAGLEYEVVEINEI